MTGRRGELHRTPASSMEHPCKNPIRRSRQSNCEEFSNTKNRTNLSLSAYMSENDTLFLLGGTGSLGAEVAKGLRSASGFSDYKAIVRNPDKAKTLKDLGWTVVQADGMDEKSLTEALVGAKVVVSTYGGGNLVDLEKTAIQAAKHAGACLYVPSQFGVDYRRWGADFPFLEGKRKVLNFAQEQSLATLQVFVGMFSDFIFGFLTDIEHGKARIIGDTESSALVSFTRRSDIGKVLAKALEDPALLRQGGTLSMQGSTMKWKDAVALLSKTIGKEFELEVISVDDAVSTQKKLLLNGLEGDMSSFYGSFALHLLIEPARGNDGADTSAEAKHYGVKLESLEQTLMDVYGRK